MESVLQRLHAVMCGKECTTIKLCLSEILIEMLNGGNEADDGDDDVDEKDGNEADEETNSGANATSKPIKEEQDFLDFSFDNLLEMLHKKLCHKSCETKQICLTILFERILLEQKTKTEGNQRIFPTTTTTTAAKNNFKPMMTTTIEDDNSAESLAKDTDIQNCFIDENSCVLRAHHRPPPASKQATSNIVPQYDEVTEFPTPSSTPSKDHTLPFVYSVQLELTPLACPIPHCLMLGHVLNLVEHIENRHKCHFPIECMSLGKCKTFFIDPSVATTATANCAACFLVPHVIATHFIDGTLKHHQLPIFIMFQKINVSQLYAKIPILDDIKKSQKFENTATNNDASKPKAMPVTWSMEDILLIWPIAPIPQRNGLRAILNVFLRNEPTSHHGASFYIRAMHDSRETMDVFSSAQKLWLTAADIAVLTNQGKQAIECQLALKI